MPSLFVVRGRDQGKHFQVRGPVTRIGRDSTNDIQLLDSEASRNHAEVRTSERDGTFQLVDLASSNGTRINGEAIDDQRLASGDRIEIGSTLMIFTGSGQPAALDAAHGVDIVMQSRANDASRIVSSLSSDESRIASPNDPDRSLEVMYLTAIAVGRSEDLTEVLNRILQLVFDWVEADRGCIMLRDPSTAKLKPAARCDRESKDSDSSRVQRISISRTILDFVIDRKEGVRTSDAGDDDRFDAAASIVQGGVREALCVPLKGRYDIVGALYVDTYSSPGELIRSKGQQRFNDDHLRLITAIGHQAALAIEDTHYYGALVQSERLAAMGQTIATLSHHVKNILQGIRGGSYLIEAGLDRGDEDAVRRGWRIVDRNQERISNLVLDMLTYSKEREPERVEADLNATVTDVVELMQTRATEMNVKLSADTNLELPPAVFDPEALHRAILNLVTNAIDACGQLSESGEPDESDPSCVGRVRVVTHFDSADGWSIDVIDNGPGITKEDRESIFSLFESSKGSRGTGLGLPVTAKILREHGGEVQVLDAPEGTGSCFRLTLPAQGTDATLQ
ncbi:MAG: ATP-binding protein [Planctomycetota bacterium]